MFRTVIFTLLAVTASWASAADNFSARRTNALKLERSSVGREYLERFMPATDQPTTKLMAKCFTNGRIGTIDRFSLVADIGEDGSFNNIEVQPVNAKSQCYADGLKQLKAPPPPEQFARSGFPIAVDSSMEYK